MSAGENKRKKTKNVEPGNIYKTSTKKFLKNIKKQLTMYYTFGIIQKPSQKKALQKYIEK